MLFTRRPLRPFAALYGLLPDAGNYLNIAHTTITPQRNRSTSGKTPQAP